MISYYVAEQILKWLSGKISSVAYISNVYVGLSQSKPVYDSATDKWTIVEPSFSSDSNKNGYSRVLIGSPSSSSMQFMTVNKTAMTAVSNKELHFDETTLDWGGTYAYACIYDAATGGNLLAYGALTTAVTPVKGNVVVIPVGGVTFSITE